MRINKITTIINTNKITPLATLPSHLSPLLYQNRHSENDLPKFHNKDLKYYHY